MTRFRPIAEVPVDPVYGLVYEHGWQSCSPSRTYRLDEPSYRPSGDRTILAAYRPETSAPEGVYQGQGLLALPARPGRAGPRIRKPDGR